MNKLMTKRNIILSLIIAILLIAIPVTIKLVQTQQQLKSRAEVTGKTFTGSITPTEPGTYTVVVNAYANPDLTFTANPATECTGNHLGHYNTSQWSDCGTEDSVAINVTGSSTTALNCTISGPQNLTVGQTGSYSATANVPGGGDANVEIDMNTTQSTTGLTRLSYSDCGNNNSTCQLNNVSWTPTQAGTYYIFCRGYDDGIRECRPFEPFTPPADIDCGTSDNLTVTVASTANYSVSGFVFEDNNSNGVKDQSESCFNGTITFVRSGVIGTTTATFSSQSSCNTYNFTSSTSGNYEVSIIPPGVYTVTTPTSTRFSGSFPPSKTDANFGIKNQFIVTGDTVTGRIYITGNEPFTAVAVTTSQNQTYELTGSLVSELRQRQGDTLTLTGTFGGQGLYAQQFEVTSYR